MRNQRQGVWSTKRALTPNLPVLRPEESEAVAGLTNAPLEAGTAGQILGKNCHTSQGAAGGPSGILKPIPYISIEEPVALEKKQDVFLAIYEPTATLFTDQTGLSPSNSVAGINTK